MRLCAGCLGAPMLLAGSAFALEESAVLEVLEVPEPMVWSIEEEPQADLFESAVWPQGAVCFADRLDPEARALYDAMVDAFKVLDADEVEKDGDTLWACVPDLAHAQIKTQSELNAWMAENYEASEKATRVYLYDRQEAFWRGLSFMAAPNISSHGSYYSVTLTLMIELDPAFENDEFRAQVTANIRDQVDELLDVTKDMTPIAKMAYWDNWLAANNDYNTTAAGQMLSYKNFMPWTVASSLLDIESPVCEGYARAFQLLCNEAGINCIVISGTGHMWNAVEVDGIWYTVDCTHNDPIYLDSSGNQTGTKNYSKRKYFLSAERTDGYVPVMSYALPPLSQLDYFYYWRLENGTIRGGQTYTVAPDMWFALYDERGKMIALDRAQSFAWFPSTNMYCAPAFDAADLKDAVRIELYQFSSDWMPTKASTKISE